MDADSDTENGNRNTEEDVVERKKKHIIGKFKSAYSASPDTELDLAQVEPAFKKWKMGVRENYFKVPTTPAPTPLRSNLIPKPPEPKTNLLLEAPPVTYLRHRPERHHDMNDPHKDMGPPPEPRIFQTPYETVKDSLNFLKIVLGISALQSFSPSPPPTYEDESETEELSESDDEMLETEYSLSRVTPTFLFSIEEVVMELDLFLNSMPVTTSSDAMKERLLDFQTRMGLPPRPLFYNLIWMSPTHFKNYLIQQDFEYDEAASNNAGTSGEADDKMDVNNSVNNFEKVLGGCYDHLPLPSLPFYDSIQILYQFVYRIQNDEDYVLDETAYSGI